MRILVLSDLHVEFAPYYVPCDLAFDVAVLAGDIYVGVKTIDWIRETFAAKPVVFVAGNHEWYGENMQSALEEMRACPPANFYHLNNESVTIDGCQFLGATLWTDYRLFGDDQKLAAMQACESALNDHRRIRVGDPGRSFSAADALALHEQSRAWLAAELDKPFV